MSRNARRHILIPLLSAAALACSADAPRAAVDDAVSSARIVHDGGAPNGLYSAAIQVDRTYYFSGKIGVTDETVAMTDGRVAAEVTNIMSAFGALFAELGLGFEDVVHATVYLADIESYAEMNEAYRAYFPEGPPARETLGAAIPRGAAVEISFVAVAG